MRRPVQRLNELHSGWHRRCVLRFRHENVTQMKIIQNGNKAFTLVEIMIVVVIIGLLAAMAIPAFQKVRTSSQDKTVLNNARQLAAAADQYFLEMGASSVTIGSLVGSTNYVKSLSLVASETYPDGFTQGVTMTISGIAGARTITFAP
jgi:type IV pilus assembly protein PilA